MAKPIGVVTSLDGSIVVVCDDGSAAYYSWQEGHWVRLPAVPNTQAAEAEARRR